jgi:hypothetical protein
MELPVEYTGITIYKETAPCWNHCRFCSVGAKTFQNISFERFENLVERFLNWKEQKQLKAFNINYGNLYANSMPIGELLKLRDLWKRTGVDLFTSRFQNPPNLSMNGIQFMPEDELRDWLLARKEVGLSHIVMSFSGMKTLHDTWVGRKGEFDFLLDMARIAAEIDMNRLEMLYLTKSTLSQMEPLMDTLDSIPKLTDRIIKPLLYMGWAKNMEDERITQDMVGQFSERISRYLKLSNFKPESEWISLLINGYRPLVANKKHILIKLREDNIDSLEAKSCNEIIADLAKRYDKVHAALPEINELAKMYGDVSNMRLYVLVELERKWTQLYLQQNPQISSEDYQIVNWW